VRAPGKPRLI